MFCEIKMESDKNLCLKRPGDGNLVFVQHKTAWEQDSNLQPYKANPLTSRQQSAPFLFQVEFQRACAL